MSHCLFLQNLVSLYCKCVFSRAVSRAEQLNYSLWYPYGSEQLQTHAPPPLLLKPDFTGLGFYSCAKNVYRNGYQRGPTIFFSSDFKIFIPKCVSEDSE